MNIMNSRRGFPVLLLVGFLMLGSFAASGQWFKMFRKKPERVDVAEMLSKAQRARQAGDNSQALSYLKQAVAEEPDNKLMPKVHRLMGDIYTDQNNCPAAFQEYQRVLDKSPHSEEADAATYGSAVCYFKSGRYQDVMKILPPLFSHATSSDRQDNIAMMLAESSTHLNDYVDALNWYAEVANGSRDAELKRKATQTCIKIINTNLSEEKLRIFVNESPNRFPKDYALQRLADMATQAGDEERARKILEQLKELFPKSDTGKQPDGEKESFLIEEPAGPVNARRIGVLLPLSGERSDLGQKALNGLMLAAHVFDAHALDVYPIELVVRDTRGDPDVAAEMVRQLAQEEQVIAIVGPVLRPSSLRAAAAAQSMGVPIITMSQEEGITRMGDMVFRDCITKSAQVKALLDYAMKEKSLSSFAVLYPDDSYGNEFMSLFYDEARKRGAVVTGSAGYATSKTDFGREINSLMHSYSATDPSGGKSGGPGFDALFLPDSWRMIAMIAPQLRFYHLMGVQLLGSNGWHAEELIRATQRQDIEGAVFADAFAPEVNDPKYLDFDYQYQSTYSTKPGLIEAQAYEVIQVLTYCMKERNVSNRAQLVSALHQIRDFPGILGPVTITDQNEWDKPLHLLYFRRGSILPVGQEPSTISGKTQTTGTAPAAGSTPATLPARPSVTNPPKKPGTLSVPDRDPLRPE